MNGIFAYGPGAPMPARQEVVAVRDIMANRGPDGAGLWASEDSRCVLGHRRLSIIDLSDRALQPMGSRDGRYTIVYNGEIYNYPELRAAALAVGRSLITTSDTEILLDLFEQHGPAMLDMLRGMFALAIWDNVARSLFLARDAFGIKPLFFSDKDGTFRFASQVRALRAGSGISDEKDPAGMVGFMLLGSVPEPFTWYADIAALPAGHYMTVNAGGVTQTRYADAGSVLAHAQRENIDHARALRRAHSAVRDSIKAHLLADVPVGLFLSGGIDSAAILGVAMEAATRPIHTITLGFDEFEGTDNDEVPIASRIAAFYGAQHNVRRIGRDEFLADIDQILATMDQPSIDGINTWFVAKAAHEQGLKVALSGVGGDELLGGYPSFTDVPSWHARYGRIARLPAVGFAAGRVLKTLLPGFTANNPKAAGLLRYTGTLGGAYLVRRSLRLPDDFKNILDPAFVNAGLKRLGIVDRMNGVLDPMPDSDHAAVTLLELGFYMRNQLLRDADWAGMRHSVEVRTPLVDIALFRELAPLIGHLRPGEGKQLLADAPAIALPEWHRHRPKTGFGIPYASWMGGIEGLAGRSATAAGSKGLLSREWSRYVLDRYEPTG
ncbi:asparagine synthase (glutamine-hydrolyzing) [Sphingomonas sp. ERG5]|uniref:asparagine synthase (glutamine-hydrolyzing) n=1 Tax=Sphingomonas sp. ERG5 TaxID=1381597 RepID=UPI00190F993A|nr:asparagine synthase (glutamine-hydrolyzing) [Sphingomonas sp. ERG5]